MRFWRNAGKKQEWRHSIAGKRSPSKSRKLRRWKSELNQTSVRLSKIVLSRSANVSQALEQLRDSNLAAQSQIRELLTAHGYPCDYLEVKYACADLRRYRICESSEMQLSDSAY